MAGFSNPPCLAFLLPTTSYSLLLTVGGSFLHGPKFLGPPPPPPLHQNHAIGTIFPWVSSLSNYYCNCHPSPTSAATTTTTRMTASATAMAVSAVDPSSFIPEAINYFGSVRFPAMFIAGTAVASIFSLLAPATQPKQVSHLSTTEWIVLRFYHAIALLSFLLSMTTVVTTTTATTSLLLGNKVVGTTTPYPDVYHFLRGAMNYEFILTRWSFLSSLLLFITGVASRFLLELQLLKPGRRLQASAVSLAFLTFLFAMVSQINCTLNCWPNLWSMTTELFQMFWNRTIHTNGKAPAIMQILSAVSLVGAVACALYSLIDLIVTEVLSQSAKK